MTDRAARFAALISDEPALLDEICQRVADGQTLDAVCVGLGVPYSLMSAWLSRDAERRECYEAALGCYADAIASETVLIADREGGGNHLHSAQRIRARQWLAGKLNRARFGDAMMVEHTGETVVRLSFGVPRLALAGSSSAVPDEDGGV